VREPEEVVKVVSYKKKTRTSKKKYVTSGTHLLDQYEVVDTAVRVEEPSSKALLSKCKSQDYLLQNNYFKAKPKATIKHSPKKYEPVKATEHFKSMRKQLRDSIKEEEEPSN